MEYPWDDWFNGHLWRLSKGSMFALDKANVDYTIPTKAMVRLIEETADKMEKLVRVTTEHDGNGFTGTIYIQATDK